MPESNRAADPVRQSGSFGPQVYDRGEGALRAVAGPILPGGGYQPSPALFEPGLGLGVASDGLIGEVLQALGEGVDNGASVQIADGVPGFFVELLQRHGEDGRQFVVGAPQGEGGRPQSKSSENPVRIAVGDLREAVNALDVDATGPSADPGDPDGPVHRTEPGPPLDHAAGMSPGGRSASAGADARL